MVRVAVIFSVRREAAIFSTKRVAVILQCCGSGAAFLLLGESVFSKRHLSEYGFKRRGGREASELRCKGRSNNLIPLQFVGIIK